MTGPGDQAATAQTRTAGPGGPLRRPEDMAVAEVQKQSRCDYWETVTWTT